jgi:hypothetical protein
MAQNVRKKGSLSHFRTKIRGAILKSMTQKIKATKPKRQKGRK